MCVALLVGGNNSTSHLIGNAMLTFIRQPEARAQLLAQPDLIAQATEEVMRYDSPVQATSRIVKETMDFGGETFEAGQGVFVLFGSGNRDEARFSNPTEFDMTRSGQPAPFVCAWAALLSWRVDCPHDRAGRHTGADCSAAEIPNWSTNASIGCRALRFAARTHCRSRLMQCEEKSPPEHALSACAERGQIVRALG